MLSADSLPEDGASCFSPSPNSSAPPLTPCTAKHRLFLHMFVLGKLVIFSSDIFYLFSGRKPWLFVF